MRNSIEIRLCGQRIALKSKEADPELVDETVELVSRLLRNAELRAKGVAAHQVVLLALLELAEEYVKAKRRTVNYKKKIEEKSQQLTLLAEIDP